MKKSKSYIIANSDYYSCSGKRFDTIRRVWVYYFRHNHFFRLPKYMPESIEVYLKKEDVDLDLI